MSTLSIIDRGGWKYARIERPRGLGRALVKSLGTRSEAEAREKVRDANLEQVARADHADALVADVWTRLVAGRKVSVRDSIDHYREHRTIIGKSQRTITEEQYVLESFVRYTHETTHPDFGMAPIAAVDAAKIAAFVNQPGPTKLATRRKWLALLQPWLAWNYKNGWLVKDPSVDVAVRIDALTQEQLVAKPYEPFTEEEVQRLLAAIPRTNFWHGAVRFAWHFGLRLGTVATLEDGNVVARRMRVFTRKGQKVVDEYLPDDLQAWLEEWRTVRPASDTPYLFPYEAAKSLARGDLSRDFKAILRKHGFNERLVFHGLRKAAARRVWSNSLAELGDHQAQLLAKLVAENGYRKVQQMLAHSEGSNVTDAHYLPKA
jgi:site-specific recombinase XerD